MVHVQVHKKVIQAHYSIYWGVGGLRSEFQTSWMDFYESRET